MRGSGRRKLWEKIMLTTKMMGVGEAEVGGGAGVGLGEREGTQNVSMEILALHSRPRAHSQEKGL